MSPCHSGLGAQWRCPSGTWLSLQPKRKKNKKVALPDGYAETKRTVVSSFQEAAKELGENLLVSLGVTRFQCAGEKGVKGRQMEHVYSAY